MSKNSKIIADHLFYKFLNDKFGYCGEPMTAGRKDYLSRTMSDGKLSWLVHMFFEKHRGLDDLKNETNEDIKETRDSFFFSRSER